MERLLTRKQVAEVLGIQPGTLARWCWEGRPDRPPEVRIGRAVRIKESAFAQWIADRGKSASCGKNPRI